MAKLAIGQRIRAGVFTREKTLFNGEAYAITSINEKGRFDILPHHANFITLIKQFVIIYTSEGEKKEFPLDNGVLEVSGNMVSIYLGVGVAKNL